jgi:hypothetical protein
MRIRAAQRADTLAQRDRSIVEHGYHCADIDQERRASLFSVRFKAPSCRAASNMSRR